jgi:hypothetical protein
MQVNKSKSELEIVIARYDENLNWILNNTHYNQNATIYNKGQNNILLNTDNNTDNNTTNKIIKLENVGRESHTYLYHIINNWDNLADRTVFFQGGGPSFGYKGAKDGGHMFSNYYFDDYINSTNDLEMIITSRVSTNLDQISIRNGYDKQRNMKRPINILPNSKHDSRDVWLKWNDFSSFKKFLINKRKEQHGQINLFSFWHKYISVALPLPPILMYAQGAQFSVSRKLIQKNSKEYYQQLIKELEHDKDCYQGYYMEWLWLYIFSRHNLK